MKSTMDLTKGSPLRQIFLFSLPLVAGTLFQQLYSFVDTIMVGRLIGQDALAAVGTTYSLNFLILGFVQGCCIGFSLPLAKETGAKSRSGFQRYFWNGCWICLVCSLVLGLHSVVFCDQLLHLIQTPADIFDLASTYLRIIFLGIPFSILYNFGSATLRASGDSTRPTIFLLVSSFLNIVLDYICIQILHGGVAGAAWATILAQLVSGLLNFWWIFCKTDLIKDSRKQSAFSMHHFLSLAIYGLPMGFEYSISALGTLIMQSAINSMGVLVIAGQTTGEKIRQMLTLPMESVGMAISTYAGQNEGAKKPERIVQGIKAGLIIQWTYCLAMWIFVFFGKDFMTALVLGNDGGQAAVLSSQYLAIMSCFFFLHGALMVMQNTLQGMGYSMQAVLSGIGELAGRSLGSLMAAYILGYIGICLANPFAWLLALIYCTIMVRIYLKNV